MAKTKENKRRDSKALYLIQQVVNQSLFSQTEATKTLKEAWDNLKRQFQGDPKIMAVKLQALLQGFETLHIKCNEGVQDYVTCVGELVNQMKMLGDTVSEAMVVKKVLRSMRPKFNHVVKAIEESRNITRLMLDEIIGYLSSHKMRLISQTDQVDEKVLQVRSELSSSREADRTLTHERGRGTFSVLEEEKGKEGEQNKSNNLVVSRGHSRVTSNVIIVSVLGTSKLTVILGRS